MISEIIPIVNLIAIIILFILYFTKKNTENFTGAPSGYTDLLVSDPDGNLDTFSLSTLETDIDTKITAAITTNNKSIASTYQTKAEAAAAKKAADASYQPTGNYQPAGNYQQAGDYVKRNTSYSIKMGTGNDADSNEDHYMVGTSNDWRVAYNGGPSSKWSFV